MMSAREIFLKYIRERNMNMTPQRALIVDAFLDEEGHFSAERLYEQVRRRDPSVGHATVYRTLKLLVDSGLADAFDAGEGVVLYEHRHGHEHHDHLICEVCGRKVEVVDPLIEERQDMLVRKAGYVPTGHRMLLFGLCDKCRKKGGA